VLTVPKAVQNAGFQPHKAPTTNYRRISSGQNQLLSFIGKDKTMKGVNVNAIKQRLIEERKTLQQRLDEEEERSTIARIRNPDRADLALVYDQAQRSSAMAARTEKQMEEIDEALKRIEDGTYGYCTNCGQEINPQRLEAIPWAALCVDCQQKLER